MTSATDPRAEAARARVAERHGALAAANDALLATAAARRLTLDASPREFERLKAGRLPGGTEGAR